MYNLSIMTKSTNELIAGFTFLTLRIWSTVTTQGKRPKQCWTCWDAVQIVIHRNEGFCFFTQIYTEPYVLVKIGI